jgi:hypothetical protein
MKKLLLLLTALAFSLTAAGPSLGATGAGAGDATVPFPEIPRVSKEQAKAMLANPDVVILDCRPVEQWKLSDQKIPGAIHEDPMNVESWAEKYSKDKTLVIY